MRILWVSRHQPLPSQIAALKQIFGQDVQIIPDPEPFDDAQDIARRFKQGGYNDLVAVAPLSVINHLCRAGIKPLYAQMVEEKDPRRIEVRGARGQGYRFDRFRRIKSAEIAFEDEEQITPQKKIWKGELHDPSAD